MSLDSIVTKVDEIGLFVQGDQSDGTLEIAKGYAAQHEHVFVMEYPFDSQPNGPGYAHLPADSVESRTYFYNWCLGHAGKNHALKWDGDCVALDGFNPRELVKKFDTCMIRGVDMASMTHQSVHPVSGALPLFRITADSYWKSGTHSEVFNRDQDVGQMDGPGFLHFKWVKDEDSMVKAWPDDWAEIPHFQNIWARRQPGAKYEGEWPSCLIQQTSS